jgi:AraC-like DNA-binding protein
VVNLLFDPETPDGRFAATQAESGLAAIDQATVHRMNPSLESWAKNQGSADDARRLVLAGLGYEHTSVDLDPRVEAVLTRLRGSDRRQIPVADLAHEVHLSPSRLATLFREQVGLPIRRYVLWLRLISAIELLGSGMDATGAAHGAGFADSPHLTRTFRSMFGAGPAAVKDSQFVQASVPFVPQA